MSQEGELERSKLKEQGRREKEREEGGGRRRGKKEGEERGDNY